MTALRRAGGRWRLLVHEWTGPQPDGTRYGTSHHVGPTPGPEGPWQVSHVLPGTEFDELVVGRWCHIEQMDAGQWWMDVGGVVLWVDVDRDGRPKRVTVRPPTDPTPGCEYRMREEP